MGKEWVSLSEKLPVQMITGCSWGGLGEADGYEKVRVVFEMYLGSETLKSGEVTAVLDRLETLFDGRELAGGEVLMEEGRMKERERMGQTTEYLIREQLRSRQERDLRVGHGPVGERDHNLLMCLQGMIAERMRSVFAF
jgi:hypothetical protein